MFVFLCSCDIRRAAWRGLGGCEQLQARCLWERLGELTLLRDRAGVNGYSDGASHRSGRLRAVVHRSPLPMRDARLLSFAFGVAEQ
jgi:hypothetical protein